MSSVVTLGDWIVGRLLGEGGFSQVRLGTHIKTEEKAALKILEKKSGIDINSTERKQVEREIDAMQKIDSNNVLKMKDYSLDMQFKKKDVILVVLELAPGGELFEYLSFTGAFEEEITRAYFHQLMEGLKAAHAEEICHRDLKPENLLLDADFQLKIADFGFAHHMVKSTKLTTECGTTGYMAPEMMQKYNKKGYNGFLSDVWACGVILFIMQAGFPPYQQPELNDWWFHKLYYKKYDRFWLAHCRTAKFSEEMKDLLNRMLTVDPLHRISVDDIMEHTWYLGETPSSDEVKKILTRKKKTVDQANEKVKVREQQKQGYGGGNVRDIGDAGIDVDADYPVGTPQDLIIALKADDRKAEQEKDTEGDESDQEETESGQESEQKGFPLYEPLINVFTKFECKYDPVSVHAELKEEFDKKCKSWDVEPNGSHQFNISAKTLKGSVSFVVSVFSVKDHPKKSIVECRRRQGESTAFRCFYAFIRNEMDHLAAKRGVIKSVSTTSTTTTTTTTTTTITTTTTTTITTTTTTTTTTNTSTDIPKVESGDS